MHQAATWGHVEVVHALLEAGAKVNIADEDGMTPLHLAGASLLNFVVNLVASRERAPGVHSKPCPGWGIGR